ncbi:MAG TPA: single-stranded-DNA-specific exonuclease RecJ [Steroidobacteraceae bacterium]|jgi:single-stranded-DNA-specific exonuclease|nr:single-stranded-DNA-specific exonuclease RecJ [Steroidobacteraceae bacterium]
MEIRRRRPAAADGLAADLHPVLRRVYAARGIGRDADLDLSLDQLLPVGSLEGLDAATRLLAAHRDAGRVLIIGDFDADGATSTALLVRALRALRFAHVDFLVPNRFRFGYGLTPEIVALAAGHAPSLIVTVDNGISSIAGVEAARELGVPVLVTDHHLPGAVLPRAEVIVNPNLAGSRFSSPALAGVGVAFYLAAALAKALGAGGFKAADLLDLVALGTVADMVPLDRNNRILVAQGIKRIRAGRCAAGILALLESAGRSKEQLSAADLGFAVAPRLNAAGRLTDMSVGIACLLADEAGEAARLAAQLSELNDERREIEQRMQLTAVELADALRDADAGDAPGICLFDASWHQGVVGLVAGRIKDRLHRPVIAFARAADGSLRGSARSVSGVNIRDALESIASRRPELIDKFGGHAMAAGLGLREENLPAFRIAFAAEIAARADREALTGIIYSDGELSAAELCIDTAQALRGAGPWGQGFPEPVFDGGFKVQDARIVGERHMKMRLQPPERGGEAIDAIAFGYLGSAGAQHGLGPGTAIQIAYRLEVNEYRGAARIQLNCQQLMLE